MYAPSILCLLLLSSHTIHAATSTKQEQEEIIHTKVVILGAGAAGISAAGTLSALNQTDFYIIDAQSFVGGRVQHAHFGSSTVELGANWIYGKGSNPIYRLASRHGLMTAPNDKSNVAFFDDKGPVPEAQGRAIYDHLGDVMEDMVMYAEKRMTRHQVDLSSRAALELLGWQPDTPLKQAVEYFALDWELAEPPEVSSLDYATGTSDMTVGSFPFGNEFVVDHRGFNYILKQEANAFLEPEDPRLLLNTVVEKVIYDDAGVTLNMVLYSLGVLQSNLVEFVPRFPDWKREALQSFHMATYTKIFLRFKEKFWADWQFALYANNGTRQKGYYTVWQNLNAPGYVSICGSKNDNILMVTVTYKESERIERMLDVDVAKEVVDVLQIMFPKITVPMPIDILVPRWRSNPLFRGTYSNWPIGMLSEHHDNMRAPLPQGSGSTATNPRLWFAGEAMSQDYYGYLHGAWIEGEKTARKIMDCMANVCEEQAYFEYVTGCQSTGPTFRFQRQDGY